MEEIYLILLAGLIPFFSWQQREEGRNLVSMLITGGFLIAWLATETLPFAFDEITMLAFGFGMWMTASVFWSHSRQSSQDLYFMLCCLCVFLVSRNIPHVVLAFIVFIPGLLFAIMSLVYFKEQHPKKKYPIFGNSNHVGAFLLAPLFSGLWLTFNISWIIAVFVLIVIAGLMMTKCRGAQAAAITGLSFVMIKQNPEFIWGLPLLLIPVLAILKIKGISSLTSRLSYIIPAFLLIKKHPFAGHGLRTFRREYPSIVPKILKSPLLRNMYAKHTTIQGAKTHRIHNDFLEIIMEIGLVGFAIFIYLILSLEWDGNIIFSGAIIAYAVHGLCFFPLREAHTAYPFWILAGGMASAASSITIPFIISLVLICIIIKLMFEITIKLLGLSYFDRFSRIAVAPDASQETAKKALEKKQLWITQAIKCDPYNNVYLTNGYYYNVFDNPHLAFQFASRCMENYDGGKVKWGVCDQYARALMRLGGFEVAKMALNYALIICPDFEQSRTLFKKIEEIEKSATNPVEVS